MRRDELEQAIKQAEEYLTRNIEGKIFSAREVREWETLAPEILIQELYG